MTSQALWLSQNKNAPNQRKVKHVKSNIFIKGCF